MAIAVRKVPKLRTQRYEDVRPLVESGDMLLCSGSAMFSKMIQKATNSAWSHVAFVLRLNAIDRVMVLESVERLGVRTVPLSNYVRDHNGTGSGYPGKLLIARHAGFTRVDQKKLTSMSRFAVGLFGYPYDRDEIVRIAARIGKSLFGFESSDVRRDREYICSEYAWECFKRVGIEVPYDARGFIAPADFARDRHIKAIAAIRVER